jgi:hypothetical protein
MKLKPICLFLALLFLLGTSPVRGTGKGLLAKRGVSWPMRRTGRQNEPIQHLTTNEGNI